VRLPVHYGMLFSVALGCHGSCLVAWQICLLIGGREVSPGVLWFGKWFLYTSCGVYDRKEMVDVLRTLGRSLEELTTFFFLTLFTWKATWLAPLVISFSDFLVLFSSPNYVSLVYFHQYTFECQLV
jgi:hypothetical protein